MLSLDLGIPPLFPPSQLLLWVVSAGSLLLLVLASPPLLCSLFLNLYTGSKYLLGPSFLSSYHSVFLLLGLTPLFQPALCFVILTFALCHPDTYTYSHLLLQDIFVVLKHLSS